MNWIFAYVFVNTVYSLASYDEATSLAIIFSSILLVYFTMSMFYVVPDVDAKQFCTKCNKQTGQSNIHCKICKRCVPIDYKHTKLTNSCTKELFFTRFIRTFKLYIVINIIVSIFYSVFYLPHLAYLRVHFIILRKVYQTQKEVVNNV